METSLVIQYLIAAALGVIYLAVSSRLLKLSRRTGETPERILTVVFAMWGAAYLLWSLVWVVQLRGLEWLEVPYNFLGNSVDMLGVLGVALFLRAVFRSLERWAFWLVVADAALLMVGLGGSNLWGDTWLAEPLGNPFYWLFYLGSALPLVWLAIEALRQYSGSRKRVRLGLCSPLVCNRYLLMGLASVSWTLYYVTLIGGNIYNQLYETWPAIANWGGVATEITAVSMFWLVFLPPQGYRRWVKGESLTAPAVGN